MSTIRHYLHTKPVVSSELADVQAKIQIHNNIEELLAPFEKHLGNDQKHILKIPLCVVAQLSKQGKVNTIQGAHAF